MAKKSWKDRIRDAFKAKDADELENALSDADEKESHVHVHLNGEGAEEEASENEGLSVEERLDRIEAILEQLVETDEEAHEEFEEEQNEGEDEGMTKDAATYMANKMQELSSRAEVLVPGFKVPTFDAKTTDAKAFRDLTCKCKKKVLDQAYQTEGGKTLISPFIAGKGEDFEKMSCATVDAAFIGASELAKKQNNEAGSKSKMTTRDFSKPMSVSDINKRNADFWKTQK